jgi:hypothetical protein
MGSGPGIAKIRAVPLTLRREKHLVRVAYGPIRAWLERADVVSEGAVQPGAQAIYFGTTSIVLLWKDASGLRRGAPIDRGALALDPHLRVRALRIAREEAELRADGTLGALRAEIEVTVTAMSLTLRVEVEANVYGKRTALRT